MITVGFKNYQPTDDGFKVTIDYDEDNCGCIQPTPSGSTQVRWQDIQGKPTCILDCETLAAYIHSIASQGLVDSNDIIIVADGSTNKAFLVDRGLTSSSYGSAAKSAVVTVNNKGIVTAIQEVDIAINATQVTVDVVTASGTNPEPLDQVIGSILTTLDKLSVVYTQVSPATVWSIIHNMGRKPSVTILDQDGDLAFGRLAYTSNNALSLTFSEAITGTAYLN